MAWKERVRKREMKKDTYSRWKPRPETNSTGPKEVFKKGHNIDEESVLKSI